MNTYPDVESTRDLRGSRIYLIEFSNGVIKIGRASRVARRLTTHSQAVAGHGITIGSIAVSDEVPSAVAAERHAIAALTEAAPTHRQNEYFEGISFRTACDVTATSVEATADVADIPRVEPDETAIRVGNAVSASGLPRFEVAERASISASAFAAKLAGRREFTVRELASIAFAIGEKPSTLLPA